jgi:hypothetical protein
MHHGMRLTLLLSPVRSSAQEPEGVPMTVIEADFLQREEDKRALLAAGMDAARTQAWIAARPAAVSSFGADRISWSRYWELGRQLLASLPRRPERSEAEQMAAMCLLKAGRETRQRFMAAHALDVYSALTDNMRRFVRVERLVTTAATLVPGLVPTRSTRGSSATPCSRGMTPARTFATRCCCRGSKPASACRSWRQRERSISVMPRSSGRGRHRTSR